MRRLDIEPRPHWQKRVEEFGLTFHTLNGVPYWDESACYQFSSREIDLLEEATQELHRLCLELVGQVIADRQLNLFLIPEVYHEWVIRSWEADDPSIYGRFDLLYDGSGPPKMLEYNADTPTALVEAAVAQWFWLKDIDERGDQYNSIHERLIEAWQALYQRDARPLHFAAMADQSEDFVTVEYLRDTAIQAGFHTVYLDIEQIGWDRVRRCFVDAREEPIEQLFKLYPWEWILREEFGPHVLETSMRWLEPPWKMVLSCKSILPLLYARFPNCPYLLPASFDPLPGSYVCKPIHAREGANIRVVVNGQETYRTSGFYEDSPCVYQQLVPLKPFEGRYPVIGSWVVGDVACGIGIREDDTLITQNTSRFVPHLMAD